MKVIPLHGDSLPLQIIVRQLEALQQKNEQAQKLLFNLETGYNKMKNLPTIVKTEQLPSTTNAWGFGGSTEKVRYTMSNGDVWIAAKAHYRHAPNEKYIQLKVNGDPSWSGGHNADRDVDLRGKAETHIQKYYENLKD